MWIKVRHVPNKEGEMFPHVPKKEKYFKGGDMPSGSSQHMRDEQQIGGGTKREIMVLGEAKPSLDGGKHPSECKWFNLSIFCKFYACFDCVVINHQKVGDCNEHGTIYAISNDFSDRMTT